MILTRADGTPLEAPICAYTDAVTTAANKAFAAAFNKQLRSATK